MNKTIRSGVLALVFALAVGGCADKASFTPAQQTGEAPPLPKARNFLVPPMQVPDKAGWKQGQTPKVAAGLAIEKIASDLKHPRQLYVLPNDDVLVVEANSPGTEPVTTPKQLIAGMVKGRSGKAGKGGNQITLLRRNPAGGPWEKHVFIQHLNSPFGVQLIGNTLYARPDTPVHSVLHEGCHWICMDEPRRTALHTDALGDDLEETGVCYLQALLADQLPDYSRLQLFADMDAWGYHFRLGSTQAWFEQDAEDARHWLLQQGLIDVQSRPLMQRRLV